MPFLQKTPAARVEGGGHCDQGGEIHPLGGVKGHERAAEEEGGEKRRRRRFVPLSIFPHFGGSLCIKRTLIEQSGFLKDWV